MLVESKVWQMSQYKVVKLDEEEVQMRNVVVVKEKSDMMEYKQLM